MKRVVSLLSLLLLLTLAAFAQNQQRILTPSQLQKDFVIFKTALENIHPQLYRYTPKAEFDKSFSRLETDIRKDMPEREFFRRLSMLAVEAHCGHTFCNLMNQKDEFLDRAFNRQTFLPFYFRVIDRRIVITQNISNNLQAVPGTEITRINGVPVSAILDKLLSISKGDGLGTTAHRLRTLSVERDAAEFKNYLNLFDIYYPLFYPLEKPVYNLEAVDPRTGRKFKFATPAHFKSQRLKIAEKRYGAIPSAEESWQFKMLDSRTAYLKLGTFFTFDWKLDTNKFLADSFAQVKDQGARNLVIDLRGNVGGFTGYSAEIKKHIARRPLECRNDYRLFFKTKIIDRSVAPFMMTYEDWLKPALSTGFAPDVSKLAANGLYEIPQENDCTPLAPYPNNFQGKVWFISDAANASAASEFLEDVRYYKLGTIVGSETGGNLQGINTASFFLRLPNSKIEVDIPFTALIPNKPQPDQGVIPDFKVLPKIGDIARGVDTELEFIKTRIQLN
jgi:hypothetical protein